MSTVHEGSPAWHRALLSRHDAGGAGWRSTAALALACAGWAAVVLLPYPSVRVLVPATFALGAVTMSRFPVLGATVICLGQAAGLALGAPAESPAGLVAGLSAMVVLGRRSRLPRALLPVLGAWGVIVATDLPPVRQVLGLALFGAGYGVGYTLRRSAERARAAEAEVRELEAVEVASRAREALEAERRRLTAESTRLVMAATTRMRELASTARESLDPDVLARLRGRGETAVDELRALLGVLRDPGGPEPAPTRPARPVPRPDWHVDVLTALVLGVLSLLVRLVDDGQGAFPWSAGLAVAAVALRRRAPAAAALVAAAGLVGQRSTGEPFLLGPAVAVALTLLVWSAVGSPTPARLAALVPLAVACVLVTAPARDSSLEVVVAILVGTAVCSHVWHRLESKHATARAQSAAYSRRVQLAVDSAVVAERLAVARDLHDVASGAIGVMMLHTSLADVTRRTDPPAARAALDGVVAAGDAALEQLALLEHALGPGPGDGVDHAAAIEALVARARAGGLECGLELVAEPHDPATAAVVWRVVNEGLTNALKHAPGSRVEVSVRREGRELVVRVRDDGAATARRGTGTGLGLLGLSEQVTHRHGSMHHGPLVPPGTGFALEARLPDPLPSGPEGGDDMAEAPSI